jgi:hypothetical protein
MRPCEKTHCSRQCRDRWAWRYWLCLERSFRTRPPDFFVVVTPINRRAGGTLATDIGKAMKRLRKALSRPVHYARVFEWRNMLIHAHLLLRVSGRIPRDSVKRAFDWVRAGGYRVSCERVRSAGATARYFVKCLKDWRKRAELTPKDFRGRVFQASAKFLSKPIRQLRQELLAEWRAVKFPDLALRAA